MIYTFPQIFRKIIERYISNYFVVENALQWLKNSIMMFSFYVYTF